MWATAQGAVEEATIEFNETIESLNPLNVSAPDEQQGAAALDYNQLFDSVAKNKRDLNKKEVPTSKDEKKGKPKSSARK